MNKDSLVGVVDRWKGGESAAQFDLERRLRPFLLEMLGLVRRQRGAPLQARIDSEGVVFHALNSFLTGVRKDEFPELVAEDDVKKVLTTLVINTLNDEMRRHLRQRRTINRESASAEGRPTHVPDSRKPSDCATLASELTAWLEQDLAQSIDKVHPKALEILELSCKEFSNNDIARAVGLGLRSVQNIKKQMREIFEAQMRTEGV